ncbi:MAG: hypothetical protein IPO15_25455 [Anaerolineae bacterium]|nr:hypothetical protein [Anaerolineae bacterium]
MMPTPEFVVGRQAEVALFDDLLAGRTPYRWLEITAPVALAGPWWAVSC